jgi:hypothetical protein
MAPERHGAGGAVTSQKGRMRTQSCGSSLNRPIDEMLV